MDATRRRLVAALLVAGGGGGMSLPLRAADDGPPANDAPAVLPWAALLPPGYDPKRILERYDLERYDDGDPQAMPVLAALRAEWDEAPANRALERQRVRLAGFLMPLDADEREIRSFLLVPYFGACLHEPAPPANQTVHVTPVVPLPTSQRGTSAVVVSGTLRADRSRTALGVATYRLSAERVEPRT